MFWRQKKLGERKDPPYITEKPSGGDRRHFTPSAPPILGTWETQWCSCVVCNCCKFCVQSFPLLGSPPGYPHLLSLVILLNGAFSCWYCCTSVKKQEASLIYTNACQPFFVDIFFLWLQTNYGCRKLPRYELATTKHRDPHCLDCKTVETDLITASFLSFCRFFDCLPCCDVEDMAGPFNLVCPCFSAGIFTYPTFLAWSRRTALWLCQYFQNIS